MYDAAIQNLYEKVDVQELIENFPIKLFEYKYPGNTGILKQAFEIDKKGIVKMRWVNTNATNILEQYKEAFSDLFTLDPAMAKELAKYAFLTGTKFKMNSIVKIVPNEFYTTDIGKKIRDILNGNTLEDNLSPDVADIANIIMMNHYKLILPKEEMIVTGNTATLKNESFTDPKPFIWSDQKGTDFIYRHISNGVYKYIAVEKTKFPNYLINIKNNIIFAENNNVSNIKAKTEQIYSQLGDKTQSENVVIKPWSELKDAKEAVVKIERKYTPENITKLEPNQVFVFGANTAGGHGGGTAGLAQRGTTISNYTALPIGTKGKWSEYGVVDKLMQGTEGKSFGIVTKEASISGTSLKIGNKRSVSLNRIEESINALIKTANENPQLEFLVTKFGTNMAGFTIEEMKSLLVSKNLPENIILPKEFEVRNNQPQIISTRIQGTDEHFGNPFSSDEKILAQNPSLIKTNSTKESVEKYIDWVINSQEDRAIWVREQIKSGKLKGLPILYYKELGEPSHATALDYLINKHDWDNQSNNIILDEPDMNNDNIKECNDEIM